METTTFYVNNDLLVGSGKRFANYVIDTIVFYVIIFIIAALAGLMSGILGIDGPLMWISTIGAGEELLLNLSVLYIYSTFMESLTQRTIGKYITGTKVVMQDGSKPKIGTILLRSLCRFIPLDAFTFFGDKSRGWHDSLSKTYVVDAKSFEHAITLKESFEEIGVEQ
ncbi:RDD family protein [Flavobacterium beibuense]|uniref:Putative membrane protein/domain-containing protein n=1 Tax=Flavobacterium beibuense TaxID=657326 RepID=A0A444W6G0_9FLAO|nr:RDD family protein [Flavobacterium beibuense]RYJ41332.1 putative membrane protein/domain-containing protein [Flavobacterium beibuense]